MVSEIKGGVVHSCNFVVVPQSNRKMKRQERNGSQIKNGFEIGKKGEELSYLHASSFLASLLVFLCPVFAMFFVYIIVKLNGDVYSFYIHVQANGLAAVFQQAVLDHIMGSRKAWTIIFSLAAFELALMKLLPGRMIKGPITPNGNVPVYKANGLFAFCVSLFLYILLAYLKLFSPSDIYDNYLDIIGALNILSLVFVFILYLKGRFAPSSSDNSVSGIFLFDFFWGTELYPRIFGWDIKMFTNCRFGLMAWSLLLVTYTWKQYEMYGWVDSMLVSVGVQLVYLAKFYHWEMGYMKSLDIMHDRAGFYICWGCLVWVPSVYTSHSLYLINNPNHLGLPLAASIFFIGILMVFINYHADYQRELVRNTKGNCIIWGRKPTLIHATYQTKDGETKNSILLVSGWWGVSRHFHYVPELIAAFCWSVPALFFSPLPYFYFFMLLILLTHRSIRDDKRCQEKYKEYWKMYCDKVPYRIVPYVF